MRGGTHLTSTFDTAANSHFFEDVDMALNYGGVQAAVCIRLIFWYSRSLGLDSSWLGHSWKLMSSYTCFGQNPCNESKYQLVELRGLCQLIFHGNSNNYVYIHIYIYI